MKINVVIFNSNQMHTSSSSDATRKRVVLAVDDKLRVCEMVRKKCDSRQSFKKGNVRQAWRIGRIFLELFVFIL